MSESSFYVHGPKEDTPRNTRSLGEFYLQRFQTHGDKIAQILEIDGKAESVTFSDILRHGKIVAGLLREHGIKPGDTVMAVCGNTLEFAPLMWGALFAAAAIAPVNPLYDTSDMIHLVNTIQPQVVVSNSHAVKTVQEALTQYNTPVVLIPMDAVNKRLKENPGVEDFYLGKVDDPDTHVATVLCTTGSSGKPKCVEIAHTAIILQLDLNYLKSDKASAQQAVSVNIAGPFGVAGQLVNLMSLNQGMKCVLVPIDTFQEEEFLRLMEKYKVNFVVIGPCQLIALTKCAQGGRYDLSNIKSVVVGGSPVTLAMYELARKHLNTTITPAYGMTEALGVFSPAYGVADRPGSVGTLAVNVVGKIADVETGKALGPRTEGEFCFKSPSIMNGYRNNPDANRAAFDADGFFHTGDTAFYDEKGFFYLVDRIKELIKYRNVHVPATDIEEVLLLHPKVAEAAVIGVYHETDWEHATAIVVVKPGETVTEEELVKLVEGKLPKLKWLHGGVRFVDAIGKSLNGKIQKRDLRAKFAAMPEGLPSVQNLSINIPKA